jgi:AmmeMemoRadiSam system protein A
VSAAGGVLAGELDAAQQATLLAVAREAIAARLRGVRARLPEAAGLLTQPRGAFVSLHRRSDGELRGCVGLLRSERPLLETVAEMAVAAATADGRFEPVSLAELEQIAIEVSALGPLQTVRPEQVEVGRHGLLVSRGGRRGVLLPQVAVEHGWDRETFLAKTCWKAGLAEDAWRDAGTEIAAFTASVFAEHDPPG